MNLQLLHGDTEKQFRFLTLLSKQPVQNNLEEGKVLISKETYEDNTNPILDSVKEVRVSGGVEAGKTARVSVRQEAHNQTECNSTENVEKKNKV